MKIVSVWYGFSFTREFKHKNMKKKLFLLAVSFSSFAFCQVGINTKHPTKTLDVDGEVRVRDLPYNPLKKSVDKVVINDSDGDLQSTIPINVLYSSGLYSEGKGKWKLKYGIFHRGRLDFVGSAYSNDLIAFSVLWDNTYNRFKVLYKTDDIAITQIDGDTISLNDADGFFDTITIDFTDLGGNWVEITSTRADQTQGELDGTFVFQPDKTIGDFPEEDD